MSIRLSGKSSLGESEASEAEEFSEGKPEGAARGFSLEKSRSIHNGQKWPLWP